MTRDKIIDQAQGFVYAMVLAGAATLLTAIVTSGDAELTARTFWVTTALSVVRSAGTAALTLMGVSIKGVS